jgi:hypothetical protein
MYQTMEFDFYGQSHPNETPELIKTKLKELNDELDKDSIDSKAAFEQAKLKCPDQLTPEFKLVFLRCEVFNVDVSDLLLRNKLTNSIWNKFLMFCRS